MLNNSLLRGRGAYRTNGKWWEVKGLATAIWAAIKNKTLYLYFFFKN
jgi:hypothetical protein